MTPRFPPHGTPEYWEFLEHWLIVERVDNERQWRLLRRMSAQLSGLNPVQMLVDLNFADGSGSGRGSGSGSGSGSGTGFNWSSGTCCFRFSCAGVSCSAPNGTFTIRRSAHVTGWPAAPNWFMADFGEADSLFYDGSRDGNSCQARYSKGPDELCNGRAHSYRLAATDGFSTGWPVSITLTPINCP